MINIQIFYLYQGFFRRYNKRRLYTWKKIIKNFSKGINVKKLIDRDDRTDEEIKINEDKNIIVLSKRHIK